MASEEVDIKGFKELFTGEYRPWYYKVWCVPVPNHEKVLDVPLLGHLLCTTGDLVGAPIDWTFRTVANSNRNPYDWEVEKMFFEMDKDRKGVLDKDEVSAVLRKYGAWETDITKRVEKLRGKDPNVYEFKAMFRGPKFEPSFLHSVPCVGAPLSNNVTRFLEPEVLTDKDIKEAFDQVDKASVMTSRKTGKLDKTQVAECLTELGWPESRVQAACDSMQEDEELDLEGFKSLLVAERARTWTTTVEINETEIPLPNPAKIHEVPLVGTATKLTQDVLYDTYDWTAGACVRGVGLVNETLLEQQFKEVDTDEDGKINRPDMGKLLRKYGKREFEIQDMISKLDVDKDEMTYDEFRDWVYGVYGDDDPIKEYAKKLDEQAAEAEE
jgi:Ca2+-binding EF-hand superfamily protein